MDTQANKNGSESLPRYYYEDTCARFERSYKRLFIALIVAVCLLFASNMMWLWAWTQYDYSSETTTYTQDGEGVNVIGDDNHVSNPGERPVGNDQTAETDEEERQIQGD